MYTMLFPALWLLIQTLQPSVPMHPAAPGCHPSVPEVAPGAIMTSVDGGQTWRDLRTGLPSGSNPNVLQAVGDELFLGTQYGLYRGSGLLLVPNWHKDPMNQKDIIGIYPGKNGAYSLGYRGGIYELQPATGLWVNISENLPDKDIYTMMESRNGDLFAGGHQGLYQSIDHGGSWIHILDKGPVFQLLEKDDALVVRTEYGLWRSSDRGDNWSRSLQTVHAPFYVGVVGEHLMAICHGEGFMGLPAPNVVYRSTDQGVTWTPVPEMVISSLFSVHEIFQVEKTMYACSGEGLFRSVDMGASWHPTLHGTAGKNGFFQLVVHNNVLFALYREGC